MDAIVKPTAGPGLELRQVPVPVPGPGEVLIKIHMKGKAQRELNLLVENGVLNTRGYGNRIIYLKSENQPIK